MRRVFESTIVATVLVLAAGCSSDDDAGAPSAPASDSTVASTTPVSLVVDAPEISGDGPPRPEELDPPTGPTACLLLSTAEVAAVVGAAVPSSEEGGEIDDQIGCQFLGDSGDPVFRLTVTGPGHSPPPAEMLDELLAESAAVAHPEIGDGGVVNSDGVTVLVGDRLFALRVMDEALSVQSDQLLALAALVASRAA